MGYRIIGLDVIKVIADDILVDAEIIAANEACRLGRQILQKSRHFIIGTPFEDIKSSRFLTLTVGSVRT